MGIAKISDITGHFKGKLGIWELTEPAESLFNVYQFSDNETEEFGKISNEKRKREYLAVRLLLTQMLQDKTEIYYNEAGKPFLRNNSYHISIAHSSELAIVLLSDKAIGTDVESLYRKTDNIASRFLSKEEMKWIPETPNSQLMQILCWSAKEAVYKNSCLSGIEFKRNILIQPFQSFNEGGTFRGKLIQHIHSTHFTLTYFFFQNNVIVYCVEEYNLINRI